MKPISDFLSELKTDLDLDYVYQDDMTFEQFEDAVYTYIQESSDIIYYSNAIDYLQSHDPSLMESMQLAADLGYTPENINSELLATLLNQQARFDDWAELRNEVESYFEEYEEYVYELENEEEE